MLVAEHFIRSLIQKYGRHTVYTDGGRWYPEACNVLGLKHHLHSPLETNLIERVMQYFKDRTESFDDYYPGIQKEENECNLLYISITEYNSLFLYTYYNKK